VLVDLLCGGLAASTIGVDVRQGDSDREHAGQSFFMLAIDPAQFGGAAAFKERSDALTRQAHALRPMGGFERVLLPGELEHQEQERRRAEGIPLYEEDWSALVKGLEGAGLPAADLEARFGPAQG
jgi:ureidoglycolate dehydrogenase (NAD+)